MNKQMNQSKPNWTVLLGGRSGAFSVFFAFVAVIPPATPGFPSRSNSKDHGSGFLPPQPPYRLYRLPLWLLCSFVNPPAALDLASGRRPVVPVDGCQRLAATLAICTLREGWRPQPARPSDSRSLRDGSHDVDLAAQRAAREHGRSLRRLPPRRSRARPG